MLLGTVMWLVWDLFHFSSHPFFGHVMLALAQLDHTSPDVYHLIFFCMGKHLEKANVLKYNLSENRWVFWWFSLAGLGKGWDSIVSCNLACQTEIFEIILSYKW